MSNGKDGRNLFMKAEMRLSLDDTWADFPQRRGTLSLMREVKLWDYDLKTRVQL